MRTNSNKLQGMTPFVLCLLTTLLLAGCSLFGGSNTSTRAPASQQVYKAPLVLLNGSTDLTTLDPALAYDQNSLTAISMIYTGLVGLNDTCRWCRNWPAVGIRARTASPGPST